MMICFVLSYSIYLQPSHLKIQCESPLHNYEKGVERHFRIQIVSKKFEGLSLIQMHRLVNQCLGEELSGGVHAVRIEAYPPSKYKGEGFLPSSTCRGNAPGVLESQPR
ncbi:unnamed protein product [Enterobius vermicularis]|uniref:BolA-like protein 1 n=1 Tax=Enterobius vermicularis TaxID=51028 RepID=A0A0N4V991_ENTVE|nr:unnamed protein product [Enterobius vermicularis]